MKKCNAFENIPTLPRTLSGQWMTFSHMANHYRKLLNVKPRVDTGIPHPLAADQTKMLSKQNKIKSSKPERPSTTEAKPKSKWTRRKLASHQVDYEYHTLSRGLMKSPNGSLNAGSCADGYQVVFGPSSIKSSMDAMTSDPDPDPDLIEPKLSSISIGEKIRKFLDNIHAQESQLRLAGSRPLHSSRERKTPSKPKEKLTETRHNRHSKCFTPFEVPSSGTKKRPVKPSSASLSHHHHHHLLNDRLDPPDSRKSIHNVSKTSENPRSSNQQRLSGIMNNKKNSKKHPASALQDILSTFKSTSSQFPSHHLARKNSKRQMGCSNMSPRSVSVGTIHGSDELVEEFMVPSPSLPRNLSTIQIDTGDIPADWLKDRVERGVVRINNAYFSLAPGTSTSSLGIHHANKDSSRDSAYGFSSGESRITTRESTPEKKSKATKGSSRGRGSGSSHTELNNDININATTTNTTTNHGQYKSSLSTVASSINQDNSSSPSHADSSGHSSCSEKSISRSYVPSAVKSATSRSIANIHHGPKPNWSSEEKYIQFLTQVTDDIVTRGIYTNKGIKNIFKAHVVKNHELEMDKMLYLLERLRMDMGVPKDDSLNHLDFGYGSVDYSTEPYFFKKGDEEPPPPPPTERRSAVPPADNEEPTTDSNGNITE